MTNIQSVVQQKSLTHSAGSKRILLVSASPHFPPEKGSHQRTYLLWKALSDVAPVDVVLCDDISFNNSVASASIPPELNFLGRFPWQSKGHWLYRFLTRSEPNLTIERLLRVALPRDLDYDVDRDLSRNVLEIVSRNHYFLAVGRYLKPIVKTGLVGRVPCLLDIDDVDFDIFAQRAEDLTVPGWQRILYSIHFRQIKAAFWKWLPQFQGAWVVKAADMRHEVTRNAAILPNIPYKIPVAPLPVDGLESATPVMLTIGVLSYLPNRDGIDRFIREGWPKIRAACPAAEYWLAGKNDPAFAKRWQAVPGVKVLGFVDDLAPVYGASWFTLCPLWTGAGTNIKVLESLAFERTCVTTVIGHKGFEDCLIPGDSLLVAATPEDLAENCVRLINDHILMSGLAKRGREVVRREFSYEKFANIVHRGVERALSEELPQRDCPASAK
jgi:glycosyltransferase involved in cell wall biosynthesis